MRRRAFLIAGLIATRLAADTRQDLMDLFGDMASALTEGNPEGFLRPIDPAAGNYAALAANIRGLAMQNDLSSSIELNKQEGDDNIQVVELEWLLNIRGRNESHLAARRQGIIKCRLERRIKKWRIVSLEPAEFFAPP